MSSAALRTADLTDLIRAHETGDAVGIYSVCSAHPVVIDAAIAQADADGTPTLIEATSNQVDQFGGYTGMRPADFRDLVHRIADDRGFDRERVVLGGDHLGPNRWQGRPAAEAMANADALVARAAPGTGSCNRASCGDHTHRHHRGLQTGAAGHGHATGHQLGEHRKHRRRQAQ